MAGRLGRYCPSPPGIRPVDLADQVGTGQPVRLPYPVSLQRALDRLSVMCLAVGKNPPQSVADLLRWCSKPLSEWELRLGRRAGW
jgi:hypothetical protein